MDWSWIALGIALGAFLPIQGAANSRFAEAVGSTWWSAIANFAVGLVALVLAAIVVRAPVPTGAKLAGIPAWTWVGGVIGACFVAGAAHLIPKIGAVTLVLCAVAGQMAASLAIDHFGLLGLEPRPVSLMRAAGVVLMAGGVALVKMG